MKAPAQVGFTFDVDQSRFSQSRGGGDAHWLAERVAANLEHAQPVHLADARAGNVHEQCAFFNHFADAGFDQVVALDFGKQSEADVMGPNYVFICGRGAVVRFSRQIGDIHETRGHLVPPASLAHAVLQHGRKRAAIKRMQILFLAQRAQPPGIFSDYTVAHGHFFVELHAHLENLAKVLFVFVEEFVELPVADEDHFDVDVDGFRLQRASTKGIKHFERLNFQPVVIERAFQRTPHPRFRQRFHRIHDQESAIGPQQRAAAQVHEVAAPAAARVVGALNRAEKICVCRCGLENHR